MEVWSGTSMPSWCGILLLWCNFHWCFCYAMVAFKKNLTIFVACAASATSDVILLYLNAGLITLYQCILGDMPNFWKLCHMLSYEGDSSKQTEVRQIWSMIMHSDVIHFSYTLIGFSSSVWFKGFFFCSKFSASTSDLTLCAMIQHQVSLDNYY